MDTPICDFVEQYLEKKMSRFHMPGHKGNSAFDTPIRMPAPDIPVSSLPVPGILSCEPWDITEIDGADDLYHADGIILKSEQNASALFGSRHTFYSTEGSSLCIRAMLYLALTQKSALCPSPRRRILAARNAHKSFLYACALLDLDVIWLYPEQTAPTYSASTGMAHSTCTTHSSSDNKTQSTLAGTIPSGFTNSICSCPISPESLQRCLEALSSLPEEEKPIAVFLTSPDYLGGLQDIAVLSAICHRFGLPLLVDNAHGAYLKFLSPSLHPLDLGADMCCDSAHKTLPALTGCAYLHISKNALCPYEQDARKALALFGSTSPSYLLLQSLDRCNAYLAESYQQSIALSAEDRCPTEPQSVTSDTSSRLTQCLSKRESACQALIRHGFSLLASDPLRIVLDAAASIPGYTGQMLADYLRCQQIECEYADRDYVVLMVTPENNEEDWERLFHLKLPNADTLCQTASILPVSTQKQTTSFSAAILRSQTNLTTAIKNTPALSIRQAVFSRSETLSLEQAVGRICAAPAVSCPPAVPIVVSGERITEQHIELCRYYGVTSLQVVAEA